MVSSLTPNTTITPITIKMKKTVTISLTEDQFNRVEKLRGMVSRSRYMQHLIEGSLNSNGKGSRTN